MDNNNILYEKAKFLCSHYDQQHLLKFYRELSDTQKLNLLNQIVNIDFLQLKELVASVNNNSEIKDCSIETFDNIYVKSTFSAVQCDRYNNIGEKLIKKGKYAVVTMAGGQGTRLGYNGPKGGYILNLTPPRSLFEIQCNRLQKMSKKCQVVIDWYIMTSEENHDSTIDFFKSFNYFGYPKQSIHFFKQCMMPMTDVNGKILLENKCKIKSGADGHGGVFKGLIDNGYLDKMINDGVEWVFIAGIDNILTQNTDSLFLGFASEHELDICCKSILKRDAFEKAGVFCKKDGKPYVIEYSEISDELAEQTDENGNLVYGDAHILCNLFSINVLKDRANKALPYHIALKKANHIDLKENIIKPQKPNAYKFETFIFDCFSQYEKLAVFRSDRETEFAPIKNAEGEDSPATAIDIYNHYLKNKSKN